MMGKVTNQLDDNVIVEQLTATQFKITVSGRIVYIQNGAGYLSVKKKHLDSFIELKRKDKANAEIIIKGEKIKFISKMYNYKKYVAIYQIPTSIIDLLMVEYGLSGTRFTVDVTILIDVEKNTQKLILEVPQWEVERVFDPAPGFEKERGMMERSDESWLRQAPKSSIIIEVMNT